MPVMPCISGGKPGFKFGESGKCFTYEPGDEEGKKRARKKAIEQGMAIKAAIARRKKDARRRRIDAPKSRMLFPRSIETEYTRALRARARGMNALLQEELAKALRRVGPAWERNAEEKAEQRQDTAADDLLIVVQRVRQVFDQTFPPNVEQLEMFARRTDRFATRQLFRWINRVVGIDVTFGETVTETDIQGWITDNVDLITSIDTRYFDDVEDWVQTAWADGRTTKELTGEIQQKFFKEARWNAERIARDQIGKLNSQITQRRQTELGIESYIWRTADDERVRDQHEAWDGMKFTWAEGSPEGSHPGEPILCRCVPEPVLGEAFMERFAA